VTDYREFRLSISGPIDGRYAVMSSGPGGDARGELVLPFNADQLENFVLKLGRSRRGTRKLESSETEAARQFGASLFDAVMGGDIGRTYRDALREQPALRLTLSLDDAPSLTAVPWEFLLDRPDFVAISPQTPVVRTLRVVQPPRPLKVDLPIRILVVSCQPTDAGAINAGLERANFETALKPLADRNALVIDWLEHATLDGLNAKLRTGGYHVIHFIGHGDFVQGMGEGALVFETEQGFADIVSADRFAGVLRSRETIRLIVLNSCEGARSSVDDPFSGVAASLIERGFPAVIGMQFEISDAAAIKFAKYFYAVLAEGEPVDRAVAEARLAMFASRDDVEWATPVLFMRVSDGHLFAISNAVPIPRAILEEPEIKPTGPTPGPQPLPPVSPVPVPIPPEPGPVERLRHALAGIPPRMWLGIGALASVLGIALAFILLQSPSAEIRAMAGAEPGWIVIEGERFRPSESVVVRVLGRRITSAVDAHGTFSLPVEVGVGAAGVVIAEGQISRQRADTQFELPGPSSGIVGSASPPASPPGGSQSPAPSASVVTGELACFDPAIRANLIVFYSNAETDAYDLYCIDPETGAIGPIRTDDVTSASTPDWFVSWSPGHDQMVFTRGPTGDRDVFTLGQDRKPVPVSETADDDWFPAWAPNDTIAFIRSGEDGTTVMRRLPGQDRPEPWFSGRRIPSVAWSPTDPLLAIFGYSDPDGLRTNNFDLGVVPLDGKEPEWKIASNDNELNPTFSSDGKTIAFVRGDPFRSSGNDIWTFDLRTGRETQLTGLDKDDDGPIDDGIGLQDGNPVWSPDGRHIAFHRASDSGFQIWVMNADGSDPHNLMPNRPGNNLDANWR
jgi:hypothetical protein